MGNLRVLALGCAFGVLGCRTAPQEPKPQPELSTKLVLVLDRAKQIRMEFVLIRAGTFQMGGESNPEDGPSHAVTLTTDYWIQTTEVTQAQWDVLMPKNPSPFQAPDLPVEVVTWNDCMQFIGRLNVALEPQLGGKAARLPTEAEWEYACRAGSTTRWSFGDDKSIAGDYSWYSKNSGLKCQRVALKKPNAWGLYDMHGNTAEWCSDWYQLYGADVAVDPRGPAAASYRCIRGGSYEAELPQTTSGSRSMNAPNDSFSYSGFRVVLQ